MREQIGLLIVGALVYEVLGLGNFSSHFLHCCIEAVFWKARAKKVLVSSPTVSVSSMFNSVLLSADNSSSRSSCIKWGLTSDIQSSSASACGP